MNLAKEKGLFTPDDKELSEEKQRGFLYFLYSEESDRAEIVQDDPLAITVAEKVTETTHLELMVMTWD